MKKQIAIIVPVYKVEKYVAECIESILTQTYTNFRLILVDDGTPDNAGKICDEYAQKDPRITVIHQENAGVTRARARGVEEADDCEFITFVDSDDTITEDALEHLSSFMNENTDIVISPVDKYINTQTRHMSIAEYRNLLVRNTSLIDTPWGKLFRKSIFNELTFDIPPHIIVHEDSLMNIRLAFNTGKRITICEKNIYNYRDNEESVFHVNKLSLDYLQEYHELRIKSIPQELIEDYIKDGDTVPTTHRIIVIRDGYYVTKGDANNDFDKENVFFDEVVGEVVHVFNDVGIFVNWVKDGGGFIYILVIAIVLGAGIYILKQD